MPTLLVWFHMLKPESHYLVKRGGPRVRSVHPFSSERYDDRLGCAERYVRSGRGQRWGRRTVKIVRPSTWSTLMVPPCKCTFSTARESPSPLPSLRPRAVSTL